MTHQTSLAGNACPTPSRGAQFTDAKFMSAALKAKVLDHWTKLLKLLATSGIPDDTPAAFTAAVYDHLNQHCGYIAHYDRHGFWCAQLGTPDRATQFLEELEQHLRFGGFCMKEYDDINKAMLSVALQLRPIALQRLGVAQQQETRNELRQLLKKARAAGINVDQMLDQDVQPDYLPVAMPDQAAVAAPAAPVRVAPVQLVASHAARSTEQACLF